MPEVPSKICLIEINMYLNHGSFACDLKDLALADGTVAEANIDDFSVFGEFDVVQDDEGAVDFGYRSVVDSGRDVVVPSHCLDIRIK